MKLTLFSKMAIAAIAIGIVGFTADKAGVFDKISETATATASAPAAAKASVDTNVQQAAVSGAIGSASNPLKVSIVSFHGYAPGLLANGGLKTTSNSINHKNGVSVEFAIQDDMPTLSTLFASNTH